MAGLLFGREANVPGVGPQYIRKSPMRFGCESCGQSFESATTPTVCPVCNQPPKASAVTLTHKGYAGKTFPFV